MLNQNWLLWRHDHPLINIKNGQWFYANSLIKIVLPNFGCDSIFYIEWHRNRVHIIEGGSKMLVKSFQLSLFNDPCIIYIIQNIKKRVWASKTLKKNMDNV